MSKFKLKIIIAVTVLFVIIGAISRLHSVQKILYPFPYRDKVESHAARYSVDRFLAISVMKVESNFVEGAMSKSGAVGLMQIMPDTADWIATQLDEKPPSIKQLHNSDTNIKYGIWYLAELEYEFFGNDVLALAAYNAGRGNVQHWMETKGWRKNFSDVDQIPFNETKNYVKKVLACREKYSELYGAETFAGNPTHYALK